MAGGSRTLGGGRGGGSGSPTDHPQSASSDGYASSTSSKPRAKRVCQRSIDPDDVVESFVAASCSLEASSWEEGLAEGRAENSRELDSLSQKMRWLENQVQNVVKCLQEKGTLALPKDAPPIDDGKDSGKN